MSGTSGNDTIHGTEESDHLRGFAGDDIIYGYGGDDSLLGDEGNDSLYGGDGNDFFRGGTGVDYFDGGSHSIDHRYGYGFGDRISFYETTATSAVIVDLRTGVISNDGFGNVEYFVDIESLGGGTAFADQFYGNDLKNILIAGIGDTVMSFGGDDWFQMEGAAAILDGGTGIDTVLFATDTALVPDSNGDGVAETIYGSAGVVVDLTAGTVTDGWGYSGTIAGVENVLGSAFDDTIIGDSNANILRGGSGDDSLSGEAGDDTLLAASGSDTVSGGDGIDTVSYSAFNNSDPSTHYSFAWGPGATTGPGGVIVDLAAGIALETGREAETNEAGEYVPPSGTASENDVIIAVDQLSGIENIVGSGLGDRLYGDDDDNVIAPGAGNDIVDGRGGIDTIDYTSARGAVNVNLAEGVAHEAGTGDGMVSYWWDGTGQIEVVVRADDAEASTDTLVNIENVYGSAHDDIIVGDEQDNILEGGDGDDTIEGAGGDDILRGGHGNDRLYGGDGNDLLSEFSGDNGPFGDDLYDGGEGYDRVSYFTSMGVGVTVDLNITGPQDTGQGMDTLVSIEHVNSTYNDDILIGNDAANWFWTNSGFDTISGNGGDDYFTVGAGDKIADGGTGIDTIEIADFSFDQPYQAAGGITVSLERQGTAQWVGTGYWTLNNIENLGGFTLDDHLTGDGNANVLAGSVGNDILNGGGGNDLLAGDGTWIMVDGVQTFIEVNTADGPGGNDVLDGGAGADRMIGGGGNDTYHVDNAGDQVVEDADGGTDTVISSINHTLGANVENLTLTGTAANAIGNGLNNILRGNDAANTLFGGAGADVMIGGLGNDSYYVDDAGDQLVENAGGGTDHVFSSVGFILWPNLENLTLTGTSNINGSGNASNNSITGNSGNNVLNGGAGADVMTGGLGDDSYYVDNLGDQVVEPRADGGNDRVYSSVSFILWPNIENITLTGTSNINASGNDLDNAITGNDGNNVLQGGAGADILTGGLGNDSYYVDNPGDQVIETSAAGGSDRVYSSVSFILGPNIENITLTGTSNINASGNGLNNAITGNEGNNVLQGGAGADILTGGLGNDTYYVDNAGDLVIETRADGGIDQVFASVSFALWPNVENLTLTGSEAINGTGNALNNAITGNDAANVINGGIGADTMSGGLGNDTYYVDNAGDLAIETSASGGTDQVFASVSFALWPNIENLTLTGSAAINGTGNAEDNRITGNSAANLIHGGGGNDVLSGGDGNDTLRGDGGNDQLYGGNGNDTLAGGAGNDLLVGNGGADIFLFDTAPGAGNVDRIFDFSAADDTIMLSSAIFQGIAAGTLTPEAFRAGTQAQDADDRIIYDSATGNIYYDADGNGAGEALLFAQVAAGTTLTNTDFLIG